MAQPQHTHSLAYLEEALRLSFSASWTTLTRCSILVLNTTSP
jgi:hypothetical protein